MGTSVDVKVRVRRQIGGSGVPALMRRLEGNSDKAAQNFADNTRSSARRRAHVITGHMRDSIHTMKIGDKHYVTRVEAYYGVYEEMGTRYRPPHPFFRPAAAEAKVAFISEMRGVFTR